MLGRDVRRVRRGVRVCGGIRVGKQSFFATLDQYLLWVILMHQATGRASVFVYLHQGYRTNTLDVLVQVVQQQEQEAVLRQVHQSLALVAEQEVQLS